MFVPIFGGTLVVNMFCQYLSNTIFFNNFELNSMEMKSVSFPIDRTLVGHLGILWIPKDTIPIGFTSFVKGTWNVHVSLG